MSDTPISAGSGKGPGGQPLDPELTYQLRSFAGRVVFDRFQLERELGEGGMGVVWLAADQRLEGRSTALKFLPGLIARDEEAIAELRREITQGLEISHAGIVRVYDLHVSEAERLAAIAMEYVDGKTLHTLKVEQPDGCFEPAAIAEWLRQLCLILTYLHAEAGVVHRDLKPRNLMLNQRGRLKLADFGIAATITETHSKLTRAGGGSSGGTPCYMSPQQARGGQPRASDDLYALGATIFELLTGKPPFFRGTLEAVLDQLRHEIPPPMEERRRERGVKNRPPVPAIWEQVVAACLAKNPEDRPSDAATVLASLCGTRAVSAAPAAPHEETVSPLTMEGTRRVDAHERTARDEPPPPAPAEPKESAPTRALPLPPAAPIPPPRRRRTVLTLGALVAVSTLPAWWIAKQKSVPSEEAGGRITEDNPTPAPRGSEVQSTETASRAAVPSPLAPKATPAPALPKSEPEGVGAELPDDLMQKGWEYQHGLRRAQDFEKAFALYQRAAAQGHAWAQFQLGWMYTLGIGVNVNDAKAAEFYQKAADQKLAVAERMLAAAYTYGRGVPIDNAKAHEYGERAAAHGGEAPPKSPAMMELDGRPVVNDELAAVKLYEHDAKAGSAMAAFSLGQIYLRGELAPVNGPLSMTWFQKALDLGMVRAHSGLGYLLRAGVGVPHDVKKAIEHYQAAADAHDSVGCSNLGDAYYYGWVGVKDEAKAVQYYTEAADLENGRAQVALAGMYLEGVVGKKSPIKARELLQRAADQGNAEAWLRLGVAYAAGDFGAKDDAQAYACFEKGAAQGNSRAQWNLGVFLAAGRAVPQDKKTAAACFAEAVLGENPDVQALMADEYRRGETLPRDQKKALEFTTKAAEQGDLPSMRALARSYELGTDGVKTDKAKARAWKEKADTAAKAR